MRFFHDNANSHIVVSKYQLINDQLINQILVEISLYQFTLFTTFKILVYGYGNGTNVNFVHNIGLNSVNLGQAVQECNDQCDRSEVYPERYPSKKLFWPRNGLPKLFSTI